MIRVLVLLLFVLPISFSVAGCATTGPQWAAYGADALQCAAPAASGAIDEGVADLVHLVAGESRSDWRSVGLGLVARWGPALAICLVERAVARFVRPAGGLPGSLPPAGEAASWLSANRAAWLP
jgi:hypothetical protein